MPPSSSPRSTGRLEGPWVDRGIAVVAVAPFAEQLFLAARAGHLGIAEASVIINYALLVVTMVLRTPPVRITRNPFYWALTFVATYWGFLTVLLYEPGVRLAPEWLIASISALSLLVSVFARLSLGRSMGMLPAERSIVTTGAYAVVRHPVYTGLFVSLVGWHLSASSWRNLGLDVVAVGLFVAKSLAEERFLSQNPAYAAYMRSIRWRFFPGLA